MTIENKKSKECQEEARQVECLPCDLGVFCRNHYFTGKLLTERDLSAEQRYFIDKLRLHHLALHGWGVVCGLRVKPHPHCPDRRLVIEPGLAIDGCGREILVPEEVEIELPEKPEPPPELEDPCPPEVPEQRYPPDRPGDQQPPDQKPPYGGGKSDRPGGYPPPDEPPGDRPPGYGRPDQERPGYGKPGDKHPDDQRPGYGKPDQEKPDYGKPDQGETCPVPEPPPPETSLYLCVRYTECETEFKPAPFDECACNGDSKRPNRICEGYQFEWELLTRPPEDWERIRKLRYPAEVEDCAELYGTALEPCPQPGWPLCLPLAEVRCYEPGAEVTMEMIDNRGWRRLLPSTRLLDRLIRCILDKLPTKKLTRIEDTGWTHGSEYRFTDFWKFFVGDDSLPQALTIRFERPVRDDGLSGYSYQAIAVRRTDKGGGGYMEVVPAKVWASPDRTEFFLRPEPDYVKRCLSEVDFELYLLLRCDLILDERGCAVDGDLLARLKSDGSWQAAPPTGNGLPGGRFESWIRVFAEPRRRAS